MKRLAVILTALWFLATPGLTLAADSLVSLTNADRAAAGRTALIEDPVLDRMAQWRADDMLARNYASHEIPATTDPAGHSLPDGAHVWDYLRADGYCWVSVGENALMQFRPLTPTQIEAMFMASPEHRRNILGPYSRIGVGQALGPDNEIVVDVIFTAPCHQEIGSGLTAYPTLPPTATAAPEIDTDSVTTWLAVFWLLLFAAYIASWVASARRGR